VSSKHEPSSLQFSGLFVLIHLSTLLSEKRASRHSLLAQS
jgi:hypothetical protein